MRGKKILCCALALLLCFSAVPGFASAKTADMYLGVNAGENAGNSFENDLWTQYDFKELKVGETATLIPRRVPEAISSPTENDVELPHFRYEILEGNSISIDDTDNAHAQVKALKKGNTVVKITYDEMHHSKSEAYFPKCDDVNTMYVVFAVDNDERIEITDNIVEDEMNAGNGKILFRSYDTMYFTEGRSVPINLSVKTNAKTLTVKCNGLQINADASGQYEIPLENRNNIIEMTAVDENGNSRSKFRVLAARKIEISIENVTHVNQPLQKGDSAKISFRGIKMPVYKLATIYNPCMGTDATYVQYTMNDSVYKGKCRQWDLAQKNSFTVKFPDVGKYTFKNGKINSTWWGYKLGADKVMEKQDDPHFDAPVEKGSFSYLPDFTVEVGTQPVRADVMQAYEKTYEKLCAYDNIGVNSIGGEWLMMGLARSGKGVPQNLTDTYKKNLEDTITQKQGNLDTNGFKYTEYERVLLTGTSMGWDMSDIAGYDIIYKLGDFERLKAQGNNCVMYALLALDSGKYDIPILREDEFHKKSKNKIQNSREMMINSLLENQSTGGGWAIQPGGSLDLDMTAMGIQALAPYYKTNPDVKKAVDDALNVLSKQFLTNGFGDVEKHAQTLTALTALGIDPEKDSRFIRNGKTILDGMLSFYTGNGMFMHATGGSENQMATEQVFYALVSYMRFKDGKTALYDMTDVQNISSFKKAYDVERAIILLQPIETASPEAVEKAQQAFDTLTDVEKGYVKNADVLKDADIPMSAESINKTITDAEGVPVYQIFERLTKALSSYDGLSMQNQTKVDKQKLDELSSSLHFWQNGNIDLNERIDAQDLLLLLTDYGSGEQRSDLDRTGMVDASDLMSVLSNYGNVR